MRWLIVVALNIVLAGSAIAYDENDLHLLDSELSRIENCSECDRRNADLRFVDFSDANLRNADLHNFNLHGANLSGADLSSANLSGADLSSANLSDANLDGADLSYAYLYGANLSGADLSGADLRYADLTDADLTDANLTDANFNEPRLSGNVIAFKEGLSASAAKAVHSALMHRLMDSYSAYLDAHLPYEYPNFQPSFTTALKSAEIDIGIGEQVPAVFIWLGLTGYCGSGGCDTVGLINIDDTWKIVFADFGSCAYRLLDTGTNGIREISAENCNSVSSTLFQFDGQWYVEVE
jgi:uncharacterized protein YjbI with pentapeptide repeats